MPDTYTFKDAVRDLGQPIPDANPHERGTPISYMEDPVFVYEDENGGRLLIRAYTQTGHDYTEVDLITVCRWIKEHRPELAEQMKAVL